MVILLVNQAWRYSAASARDPKEKSNNKYEQDTPEAMRNMT